MAWVTLNDCLSTVSIAKGGTGLTSAPMLATNLASTSAASIFQSDPRPGVVGTLPVANGGTGSTNGSFTSTGQHKIKIGITDITGSAPSENQFNTGFVLMDRAGNTVGIMEAVHMTDGRGRCGLYAVRDVNGTIKYNGIGSYIDSDGNFTYSVSNPAAFRNMLGLGNTSGAVPIANGGTGATTAAAARKSIAPTTKLWSGTLSRDGSVTISDINNWRIIGVRISLITEMLIGAVTPYLQSGSSTKTYFSCATQVDTGSGSAVYKASFEKVGTTLKLGGASKHTLPTNGANIAGSSVNVLEIWGLY